MIDDIGFKTVREVIMRILMVTNMYPSEDKPNYGCFVKSQVDSVRNEGVEVDVLYIRGYKSNLFYITSIFTLWWRCLNQRYDFVHAHYGLSGIVARTQFLYPVIVSYCGDDLYGHAGADGKPTKRSLFEAWFSKQLSRFVRAVIVKARVMIDLLPIENAYVIPNGVDFNLFKPMDRIECREHLGLEKDRIYVLFPYDPKRIRKNYSVVKKAVDFLNDMIADQVEILTVEGMSNTEIPYYMNAADVMVLASFWEGSPNAVKEALACNTRVVSVDVGDVPELLEGVSDCLLCDRTAEDLANKLNTVLAGKADTNGRERIQHLEIGNVAKQVIEVYNQNL